MLGVRELEVVLHTQRTSLSNKKSLAITDLQANFKQMLKEQIFIWSNVMLTNGIL